MSELSLLGMLNSNSIAEAYLDGSELLFYCSTICLSVNKDFLDRLIISIVLFIDFTTS